MVPEKGKKISDINYIYDLIFRTLLYLLREKEMHEIENKKKRRGRNKYYYQKKKK